MPHAATRDLAELDLAGKSLHFVGIGGSGMNGLARMLARRGARCSGSDANASEVTDGLAAGGIAVEVGSPGPLPAECDLVIRSAAIRDDHPQILEAESRGIRHVTYAEALGFAQTGRTTVSIAGTHGKSSTSALLGFILERCGLDPSIIVGANVPQIAGDTGGGSRSGAARLPSGPFTGAPGAFVCEACEFNRSFHHHRPTFALINNVEEDHLDCYGSLDEIVQSFRTFAELLPPADPIGLATGTDAAIGGKLLIAHEGAHRREIAAGLACRVETFGFSPSADWQVVYDARSSRAGVLRDGHWVAQWDLKLHGDHMALNSAAAAIIAHWFGAEWEDIAAAIARFRGVERRMQRLGTRPVAGGEVTVYDDYAHHPTECERTLKALRAAEQPKRLICVFQPHQHSRTRFLLDQFAASFETADVVLVPHIYFVRDSEIEKTRVSAGDLVDRLRQRGTTAMHLYPFAAILDHLEVLCRPGDLVVVMGAGPVGSIAHEFLARGTAGARGSAHESRPASGGAAEGAAACP
jgi:UDP-N-acetylmuramate--alanine ligase